MALAILAGQTRARAGVLFSVGDRGLYCAAQQGDVSRPEAWLQHASELLAKAPQADSHTPDSEVDELPLRAWIDAEGRAYQPIVLSHVEGSARLISGVAVLATEDDGRFQHRAAAAAAAAISRYFAGVDSVALSQLLE